MVWIYILAIVIPLIIWKLFGQPGSRREILHRLVKAIASITTHSTTPLSNEERRWVVIGVCLTKVLTPALRNVLATEIPKWHQALCRPPTDIDKQVFGGHQKKLHPSTSNLNYKSINNNDSIGSPLAFDYAVKDPLSLAKLFVKPSMSKFTGFNQTMDTSAVLSVICEAAPFVGAAAHAKTVRSDIRNEWAHCNFAEWTEQKFIDAFQNMETLLKNVNLAPDDEQKLCDELNSWKEKGFQLCFGQAVDIEMLTLLKGKVDELCEAVQTWNLEKGQVTTLVSNITDIQSNLCKEIDDLRMSVENIFKDIKLLDKRTNELSRSYIKEEEKIPYVFTAPPRNRYFAGRTGEIQELKRILKVEETLNEKKVRVAAVYGLGGIGKTNLVSEYAHQMKDFYKGGVYWFSAEDDAHLSKTVNAVAVKIGALLSSFDLTLPNILKKISTVHDPCLILLDCLDQLDLSSKMMEFLSFPSKENFFGHFILLTRRNPKRLVNDVLVFEEKFCLQLECLQSEEAKQFLFARTKVKRDENGNAESVAECLCEKLGRLPLALEQAGAYIQMLGCSLSSYLEQYESQRLQLLSLQAARPVSPGNESSHRLAVHTTWRINIEYIEKSTNGQAAVRFMNACSFFDENEIQKELVNVGAPEVEDVAYRKCVSSPLGSRQVLKLLTDFSLFRYVEAGCVTTHRLVQELLWENLDPKSKAESFIDAVRMLSFAFSTCPSPSNHISLDEKNGEEQDISFSGLPNSPSHFYMWSKFCMHGHRLRRNAEDLLVSLNSVCLDSVWFPETAKILYECAVHLSANRQQEEAKRTLNFAYRILDWLPLAGYDMVEKNVSDDFLFPLPIPLPELFQMMIQRFCIPTFILLESLTEKPTPDASDLVPNASDLAPDASDLAPEASDLAADASDLAPDASHLAPDASDLDPDASDLAPLLFTNRSMVYLKLEQCENALTDANDYITRRPYCWKGYALKALALGGWNKDVSAELNDKASAEIAAALALYHNRGIFTDFPGFVESSPDLQSRIFICNSVDELLDAMFSQEVEKGLLKILVLGSEEYILSSETVGKPWNNCILVGTRKNCSVSLKSNYDISLLKCMLTNLSFSFNECQLHCLPDSLVKVLNCNFTSCDDYEETIKTEGVFDAEQCNFTRSPLLCATQSRAVVRDCSFCNNTKEGLRVEEGGALKMENSRIYNNGGRGLFVVKSECVAVNCDIHDNGNDGIIVAVSKNVTLIRNNVYNNNGDGIYMKESLVDVKENNLSDNGTWGIMSQDNLRCNILMNTIFRNKSGGVFVLCEPEGETVSLPVMELNKISHNGGPGLMVNHEIIKVAESLHLNSRNSFQSGKFQNNEMHHNKENENDSKLNLSVPYCSYCRVKCNPIMCEKCFTTAYCSESCQKQHYWKHKKICKFLREKSSYLITSMQEVDNLDMVACRSKEVGPKLAFPPRDDMRFVVIVGNWVLLSDRIFLYDRERKRAVQFKSKVINQLIKEFGVLCEAKLYEKKLYFHCLVEDNGQLRLFTNAFAEF